MFSNSNKRSYYYTRSQKRGILFLFLIIIAIQCYIYLPWFNKPTSYESYRSLYDQDYEDKVRLLDSLYEASLVKKDTIYPFNPNFISDYRGFILDMTVEEIDRLFAFRKENKYVNSAKEFQQVTQVSDEWLARYSPYFKFPDWVNKAKKPNNTYNYNQSSQAKPIHITCINSATVEDLQEVRGIGPYYADKIIKEREKYNGFVSMEQVKFIYGISPEVYAELSRYFTVNNSPAITTVNINTASVNQLKEVPYMNYYIAREVVKYRSMHGDFVNKEELLQIEKFPVDKIDLISLYLSFTN